MNNHNPETPLKQCSKCGEQKPETAEYFRWCKNGGVFRGNCKVCEREYSRRYREANPDKVRERVHRWRVENPDKVREYSRQYHTENADKLREVNRRYRAENADKIRERHRRYNVENAEKIRERRRRYRAENPDKIREGVSRWRIENADKEREYRRRYYIENGDKRREYARRWQVENPDKSRANDHRRRARLVNADGNHTAADIRLQIQNQTNKKGTLICWWCSKPIKDGYHIDHRIPLARGGSNNPDNIVIAHPKCNMSKSDKLPHEFNGRLL